MTTWTDKAVDQLREMLAERLSASVIAAALGGGCTRNAVIGKVHRLGMAKRREPPSLAEVRQRVERRAAAARAARPHVASPSTALVVLPLPKPRATLAGSGKVRLLDRLSSQCCWPTGGGIGPNLLMCGLPVARRQEADQELCEAHQRIGHSRGTPSEQAADREAA